MLVMLLETVWFWSKVKVVMFAEGKSGLVGSFTTESIRSIISTESYSLL